MFIMLSLYISNGEIKHETENNLRSRTETVNGFIKKEL